MRFFCSKKHDKSNILIEDQILYKGREIEKLNTKRGYLSEDFHQRAYNNGEAAKWELASIIGIAVLPINLLVFIADWVVTEIRESIVVSKIRSKQAELGDLQLEKEINDRHLAESLAGGEGRRHVATIR